jgi:hypothetical protein
MITIEAGAAQLGLPVETLELWIRQGLLDHKPGVPEQLIDEDRLYNVAESLGWLRLSCESWDGPKEE